MREFIDVLLDGVSIRDKVISVSIERSKLQAVDLLTLELADFSLYASFDFGLVPLTERLHVGTAKGAPKTDGATSASGILTSAGSDFTAEGFTTDDIIHVIDSSVAADIGGWPVTAVGTTTITSSHTFGTATGMTFIILTNQGKFFGEKPDVLEDKNQISIPSLWGRNALARLTDPFVGKLTKTFKNQTTFSVLVKDLVADAGMDDTKVVIDIDDFIIPGNLLSISQRLPLQVIIDLATKTNGYVRSTKAGDLHIKKDIFHWGALSIADTFGDNEIQEMNEVLDFPEFGNRILVRSVLPESGQDIKLTLSLDTSCIRGDGRARAIATVVVTDLKGNPVPDNTIINWTRDDTSLFSLLSQSLTSQKVITAEAHRSSSLITVSATFPIVTVLGVFLKQDTTRLTNFFTGGSFLARTITLGVGLPFTNSEVFVDYIAGGVSEHFIQSVAGATEGESTFISAFVGRVRDSKSLCIRNTRNIFLRLRTDPSEHNLCLPGAHDSTIIAQVRDNGETGLIGIAWSEEGPGDLSKLFSLIKNTLLESEFGLSSNFFTVNTQYDIVSVVGVWLAEDGKSGTNLFTTPTHRTGSFDGKEIILGTDLPDQRERVIIEYTAKDIAVITFIGPTTGTGPDISVITAKIKDGTEFGIEATEDILFTFRCPDPVTGEIPGIDPSTGFPERPSEEEPCVPGCGDEDCPDNEEDCRTLCQNDYNKDDKSTLNCETQTASEFCLEEVGHSTGQEASDCRADHETASVDACTDRCADAGGGVGGITITPGEATMPCGGSESVVFTASGGAPPYSWDTAGGEGAPGLVISGQDNETATLTPPVNNPSEPGQAYHTNGCCNGSPPANANAEARFGCDDVLQSCDRAGPICPGAPEICSCTTPVTCSGNPNNCIGSVGCLRACASQLAGAPGSGDITDDRTQTMIDNGCLPCTFAMDGASIMATDAFGNEAIATIEVP